MQPRRPIILLLAAALIAAPFTSPSAAVALDASAVLPDLGMLPPDPTSFSIQSRPRGQRWLRFDTVVVNVGPGLFDVYGYGPADADGRIAVRQRVENGSGGWTTVETPAEMFYAEDGHNHWHVEDLQDWTLENLNDKAVPIRSGAKRGFCFWDNYDYTATEPVVYHPSLTSACMQSGDMVPMGLSVGWGDEYPSNIAFQYIDIGGLPNGDYLLTLEADLDGEFVEADEDNNTAWAVIRIGRKAVKVLSMGTDLEP